MTHPLFCTWFVHINRYENGLGITPFVNFTDYYGMTNGSGSEGCRDFGGNTCSSLGIGVIGWRVVV